MKRNETRTIKVGNLTIGGNNEVIIQSMTNIKTLWRKTGLYSPVIGHLPKMYKSP